MRCEEMWGGVRRCDEVWGGMGRRCEEMWGGGTGLIDAQKCTFSEGAEIVGTIYTNVHHIDLLDVHTAL